MLLLRGPGAELDWAGPSEPPSAERHTRVKILQDVCIRKSIQTDRKGKSKARGTYVLSVPCEAGVVCERAWGGMRMEFNCGWIDSSAGRERQRG